MRLPQRYDELWSAAIGKIRTGAIEIDPVLAAGTPDPRRGLTLIARPSLKVRRSVVAFLRELRRFEPDQHYYAPSDLHLTILSLFTATVDHKWFFKRKEKYVAAVESVLRRATPIRIEFRGVTASPGAILIQGFPENEMLKNVRDALRRQLRLDGLSEGLDARYRLETAHITVARFRARLRDGECFANALEQSRRLSFGTTTIKSLSLVRTDWYMTRRTLQILKRYRLPRTGTRSGN